MWFLKIIREIRFTPKESEPFFSNDPLIWDYFGEGKGMEMRKKCCRKCKNKKTHANEKKKTIRFGGTEIKMPLFPLFDACLQQRRREK